MCPCFREDLLECLGTLLLTDSLSPSSPHLGHPTAAVGMEFTTLGTK